MYTLSMEEILEELAIRGRMEITQTHYCFDQLELYEEVRRPEEACGHLGFSGKTRVKNVVKKAPKEKSNINLHKRLNDDHREKW